MLGSKLKTELWFSNTFVKIWLYGPLNKLSWNKVGLEFDTPGLERLYVNITARGSILCGVVLSGE